MNATRAASVETLAANVRGRLDRMLAYGTTFCEAKTGYGLDLPNEKKQLAVLAEIEAMGTADEPLEELDDDLGEGDCGCEGRGCQPCQCHGSV